MKGIKKMKMALLASGVMVSAIVAGGVAVRAEDGATGRGNVANRLCSAYCSGAQGRRWERQVSPEELEKYHQQDALQRRAVQAAEEMNQVLSANPAVWAVFGGMYIGDAPYDGAENVLVVVLTMDSEEIRGVIQCGIPSQEVRFQKGKYTLVELEKLRDEISDAMRHSDVIKSWKSFGVGVNVFNNTVQVTMPDLSYVDWFKREISDADCLEFREGTIVLAVCVQTPKVGATWSVKDISYKITKKTAKIREVRVIDVDGKSRRSVTIPAAIKLNKESYKVVGIGKNAFKGMKKLKKVTIGKNVRKIDRQAFKNCKRLKTVKILSKKCSYSGKCIRKGASKKLVIQVPKSARKK